MSLTEAFVSGLKKTGAILGGAGEVFHIWNVIKDTNTDATARMAHTREEEEELKLEGYEVVFIPPPSAKDCEQIVAISKYLFKLIAGLGKGVITGLSPKQ